MNMKNIFIAWLLLILLSNSLISSALLIKNKAEQSEIEGYETEYWALLVGVTEIANSPSMDIPYNKLVIENFRDMLLVSDFWQHDHIQTLIGREATYLNIIRGFKWLDRNADENDVCVVYITTHGGLNGLIVDLPPFDETDGDGDEVLYTWTSGVGLGNLFNRFPALPRGIPIFGSLPYIHDISDDQLKRLLNKLDAKGVCVIIDACFSGGFNDYNSSIKKGARSLNEYTEKTYLNWGRSFAQELHGPGRVILMSCGVSEKSQGACFTYFTIEGFQGYADADYDGLCSAEEVFQYAAPLTESWLKEYKHWDQHPEIYDDYPGELLITQGEKPPLTPIPLSETHVGEVNTEQYFLFQCSDPEQHKIRLCVDWDDSTNESTGFFESGGIINISHTWVHEGTYNLWVIAEDEHGAQQYSFGFPMCFPISIVNDESHHVDQSQMMICQPEGFYECEVTRNIHQAQSFIPTTTSIDQVNIWALSLTGSEVSLTISLRDNLMGDDLVSISKIIPALDMSKKIPEGWTSFDFGGVDVIPSETYYIVCSHEDETSSSVWFYADPDYPGYPNPDDDPYPDGQAYISKNGGASWVPHTFYADDFCFVTYGY